MIKIVDTMKNAKKNNTAKKFGKKKKMRLSN